MTFTEGQIVELNSDLSLQWSLFRTDKDFIAGEKFRIERIANGLFELSIPDYRNAFYRNQFSVTYDQAQKYFAPKGPKPKLTLRDLLEDEE